jgi:hypothetical protein
MGVMDVAMKLGLSLSPHEMETGAIGIGSPVVASVIGKAAASRVVAGCHQLIGLSVSQRNLSTRQVTLLKEAPFIVGVVGLCQGDD